MGAPRQRGWRSPRRASATTRHARGPLHGLPVGVKDVIDTADLPTAYGSPIYARHRPDARRGLRRVAARGRRGRARQDRDDRVRDLRAAADGQPARPRPHAGRLLERHAAAVAAGMVPLAYGTQTAGSVIRPASFCGVAGFKPAHGWRSTAGIKRLSERLDTLGLLGRSVADAALLGGFEAPSPREGRVAFCRTPWWDGLEDGGRAALEEAAVRLGAEEVELPAEFAGLAEAQETVMAFDVARNLEPEWREHRDELSAAMRDYLERARTASPRRTPRRVRRSRSAAARCCPTSSAASTPCSCPARWARRRCASRATRAIRCLPGVDVPGGAGAQRAGDGGSGGDAGRGAARRA